ncbi:ABC transporter permease [Moheibacter stercoris]
MKNVSLYIAKRYNTNTLLISMLLIAITSFLVGTLIYIGDSSFKLIQQLLFPRQMMGLKENLIVYGIMFLYLFLQSFSIYYIFNKTLVRLEQKSKLLVAFVVAVLSVALAGALIFFDLNNSLIGNCVILILISSALLSLIFGFLSFLLSKRRITGVNIITSIAVFAITIATTSLFIILSVFSGLEKMNLQFFSNVNPDLKISSAKGKTLSDIDNLTQKLTQNPSIESFSKVIEEKVSIEFGDKEDIAYIKGIDEHYNKVVRLDTLIQHGSYFNFQSPYEIIASEGVARRLQMYIDRYNSARLRMPKPGTGMITSETEAFNSAVANPIGVTYINDSYDKYILSPIELTQILLELPPNSAYSLELKLKPGISQNSAKAALQKELGDKVVVQTRQDLDATFIKVMNVENLIIYLIFTLVIIIACFNLAGAIIIIIIDKKVQIKTMWSFGMQRSHIKQIFFQTGLLITFSSILFGLTLGSIIGLLQNKFQLVMANSFVAFPFEFTLLNYITVTATVLIIGAGVSYMVSRKLPS